MSRNVRVGRGPALPPRLLRRGGSQTYSKINAIQASGGELRATGDRLIRRNMESIRQLGPGAPSSTLPPHSRKRSASPWEGDKRRKYLDAFMAKTPSLPLELAPTQSDLDDGCGSFYVLPTPSASSDAESPTQAPPSWTLPK